jgi:hypothetical protein
MFLPPVGAQTRKEIAVQLLTMDADDDCLSQPCEVSSAALAAVPAIPFPVETRRCALEVYAICALGSFNVDLRIHD